MMGKKTPKMSIYGQKKDLAHDFIAAGGLFTPVRTKLFIPSNTPYFCFAFFAD
jgi:hypothetical protein